MSDAGPVLQTAQEVGLYREAPCGCFVSRAHGDARIVLAKACLAHTGQMVVILMPRARWEAMVTWEGEPDGR